MALVGWFDGIENQTVPSNSLSATKTLEEHCVDYLSCTSQNQAGSENTSMCLIRNN